MAERMGSCIGAIIILGIALIAVIIGLNLLATGMGWVSPLCFIVALVLIYFAAAASPIRKD